MVLWGQGEMHLRVVTERLSERYGVGIERRQPTVGYRETIQTLRRSLGCATDSGGLQEESATLGIPCAVLRHRTDRPARRSANGPSA